MGGGSPARRGDLRAARRADVPVHVGHGGPTLLRGINGARCGRGGACRGGWRVGRRARGAPGLGARPPGGDRGAPLRVWHRAMASPVAWRCWGHAIAGRSLAVKGPRGSPVCARVDGGPRAAGVGQRPRRLGWDQTRNGARCGKEKLLKAVG